MKRTKQIWDATSVLLTAGLLAVMLSSGALASAAYDSGIVENVVNVHVPFIENEGQVESDAVKFYARTFGGTLFVEDGGILTYSLPAGNGTRAVIREFLSDREGVFPVGIDPSATMVNYFIGKDSLNWQSNLPTYNAVSLGEVYAGTSLSLKAHGDNVEKIFTIEPYANPDVIRVRVEGVADALRVNEAGELEIETTAGVVRFTKPVAFQESGDTREEVAVAYTVYDSETYGFTVGNYDSSRPLIIDPLLASTFIGGSGKDMGCDITVDRAGNVYVTGQTSSTEFPATSGAYDTTYNGGTNDVFVAKLSADCSTLVYSTYIGGGSYDYSNGIVVDNAGNAYITGASWSTNFPTTDNAQDKTLNGGRDGFVAKLNADGDELLYSTYLGGSSWEYGQDIAVDDTGNAYITGFTHGNFPTTTGTVQPTHGGSTDPFVAKLNADGSTLIYSTYLGGSSCDGGSGIDVDSDGNAYITGDTHSTNFPIANPLQSTKAGGGSDAFVAKLNADGSGLIYSTYLGGSGGEDFTDITIDGEGNAYLTGHTYSTDFPTTTNALQPSFGGGDDDALVVKLNADGSDLIYSTHLGGSGADRGYGIVIDGDGNVYVTGYTSSTDFPTADPLQAENGGGYNAFVAKLNDDGSTLLYSTYLGGSGCENIDVLPHGDSGIAIDDTGNIYLTGSTTSTDFPTESPLQPNFGGGDSDAFVAKISTMSASDETIDVRGEVVELTTAQSAPILWDAYNFGAFWYDLDGDQMTETLTIAADTLNGSNIDRTIDDGNLTYQTAPVYREYEVYENKGLTVDGNTGYYLEGWIGDAYVAINGSADKLCKLLVEFEDRDGRRLAAGKEWDLGGGFALVVDQIDLVDEEARFTLIKNGSELDNKTVSAGNVYVYTAEIGGSVDVPVFSCYMGAVYGYGGTNRTQIKYVFLIDDSMMEIECGSEYGAMEVMTANPSQIVLENDYSVDLDAGETERIMGDLYFMIADDVDAIRFYPYVEHTEPMTYEIRGEVQSFVGTQSTDVTWDAYNFGAFWYGLDDDLMTETMTIAANTLIGPDTDRTIDENCLSYQTSPVYQEYEVYEHEGLTVDGNTGYYLELIGERYVALNGSADKLRKLLIEFEDDEWKTLCTGEEWYLGEGLSIVARLIDPEGGKVWFCLSKDGSELDSEVVSVGEVYTYTKDICVEDDVLVFSCYVDSVFRGTDSNVVLKYVFMIDDCMMKIDCDDEFGAMKVVYENSSQIVLKNYEPISLVKDREQYIMDNLYFKTANDSSAIRLYPFTKVTISEEELTDTIIAVDADCDGVPDAWDEEPDTPADYYTDSHGQGRRWGDMNGDGKLTSVDALMILQAAAEAISL